MPVVIVGSVALDTVRTAAKEHTDSLGGSASYAVGSDFPDAHLAYFQSCGIGLEGLERTPGATCCWSVGYATEMNECKVRS